MHRPLRIAAIAAIAVLSACGGSAASDPGGGGQSGATDAAWGGPPDAGPDLSDQVFDSPMLEVAIDIEPDDWDALRHQRKTRHTAFGTADCRSVPVPNPYTWFPGTVTIDGEEIGLVGVRKKGHIGSQSTLRPSLKLRFDRYTAGTAWRSLTRLALNNSKQDASYARTCVTYERFRKAGVPAPRCTFAHLTINGDDFGVYLAVEEVDKEFVRRNFDDPEGNLYEGTASDFRPEFIGGFEQETNQDSDPSHDDLQAVLDVLDGNAGPDLAPALDQVIALDEFYRFWATESLVWHRDGYGGNANNFFLYADPSDGGRFHFIPWGADSTFITNTVATVPDSVLAFGAIANRLYLTAAGRERYDQELDAVIEDAWRPTGMAQEVTDIHDRVRPLLLDDVSKAELDAAAQTTRDYILGRAAAIDAATADGPPPWTEPMRALPCRIPVGTVSGTFTTTWDSLGDPILTAGSGTFAGDVDGDAFDVVDVGARSGMVSTGPRVQMQIVLAGTRRLNVLANFQADERWFEPYFTPGEHPLVTPPLPMSVTETDTSAPQTAIRQFDVGEGTWTFTAASTTPDAPVEGSFEATLYLIPPPAP
jgi:hypothetical protein